MGKADLGWLRDFVGQMLDGPLENSSSRVMQAQRLFLEQLCDLLHEYAEHFNYLCSKRRPDLAVRVFRFANPKPGVVLLRGRDKLVVCGEGQGIKARVVQVQVYRETSFDAFEFEVRCDRFGCLFWAAKGSPQFLNPDLVCQQYLAPFFVLGSKAYQELAPQPEVPSGRVRQGTSAN